MHEIAWTRVLRHVLGGSSLALTSVLVAFLGGLAIGAWWVERRIDRWSSPLAVFGRVEILIGVWTLSLPMFAEATWPLWRALYADGPGPVFVAARFVGALLLLAPAAIAMGASLPLLASVQADRKGPWVARLYGFNALGAAAGALVAGFVLLPGLGLTVTVRSAAGINLVVGAAALVLARGARPRPAKPAQVAPTGDPGERHTGLLATYAVAGAALLVHEVAWARVATLLLGSTVYAYSLLLAVIVGGLAVGGLAAAWLVRTPKRAAVSLVTSQALAGACGLAVIAIVPLLPPAITGWFAQGADAGLGVTAAVLALLFFLPSVLMGAAYPLVCRLVLDAGTAAKPAARVQAAGNLGALAGVCVAAFVLLPRLGLHGTLLLASGLNAFVAVSIAWRSRNRDVATAFPGAAAVARLLAVAFLVAGVALPSWAPARLSFGPFVQARRQPLEVATSPEALRSIEQGQRVLYHRDGRESSMTVKETADGERSLWINGKPDASSASDLATQRLLAHVPLALHGEARSVMIVGLASGVTLRSAAAHPLERIVTVDISDQAEEVASWFAEINGGVLSDPRVQLIVADGRLHLTLAGERYDVIVSEPSNPWMAGIGDLYTAEFFSRVRDRLEADGLFCLWLPAYHLDATGFRSVARTFVEVFPHAGLWHTQGSDYLLVGSASPRPIDLPGLAATLQRPGIGTELEPLGIRNAAEFLSHRVLHGRSLERFSQGAPRHTDDNALLEFRAPHRLLGNPDEAGLLLAIESFRGSRSGIPGAPAEIDGFNRARGAAIRANLSFAAGQGARALALLREAAESNVEDVYLERTLAANQAHADALAAAGERDEAIARYRVLLEIAPDRRATHEGMARLQP